METLQKSKIIKVISKKLVRKAIEMLRNLAEKDESKEEKDGNIGDDTKEVDFNENREVVETDNDNLLLMPQTDILLLRTPELLIRQPSPMRAGTTMTLAPRRETATTRRKIPRGGRRGRAITRLKTETTKTKNTMKMTTKRA